MSTTNRSAATPAEPVVSNMPALNTSSQPSEIEARRIAPRNIILLAQLVSVEDYGIASTFIAVLGFVALVGDLVLDRLIVQGRRGEEPRFGAAVQAVIVVRAIVMSALMILAGYPTAVLFGKAQMSCVFALLGLLPMVQVATHPDLFRLQRCSCWA